MQRLDLCVFDSALGCRGAPWRDGSATAARIFGASARMREPMRITRDDGIVSGSGPCSEADFAGRNANRAGVTLEMAEVRDSRRRD